MTFINHLLLATSFFLYTSCAKNVRPLINDGLIPLANTIKIPLNSSPAKSLSIIYTGCGGLMISKGKEALLTDPFYTGQWFGRMLLGIKTKPKNVRRVFKELNSVVTGSTDIKGVLVAHSHYDHLLDLPYLLAHDLLPGNVRIVGSPSASCTIHKFMQTETFINAENHVHQQNDSSGTWISIADHIRVMPIRSAHAPHTGKRSFMTGNTCDKGFRFFNRSGGRSAAFKWKSGPIYSFLIDILKDDKVTPEFRIFLQSSACSPPSGFPSIDDGKNVDVALLGVALSQNVKDYPAALLTKLKVKKVILIHWEDFFRNLYHKKPKSVRLTDLDKFITDLKIHYKVSTTKALADSLVMPRPLTEIILMY